MSRNVLQVFETYQKAVTTFVQEVAEMATRPQNIEPLMNANVMNALRPLLLNSSASVQQSASLALGRLANYSDVMAEAIVANEVLPQLVYSLAEQNKYYKKAAAFVLRAVAKHSPALAQAVVDCGALEALVSCLEEFDPGVKEAAAWALGYIARHTAELAQAVVDSVAIPLLVLTLQEPELPLKRIAASCLADIAKHTPELAQSVVDGGAVSFLVPLIQNPDVKLKRQVCSCLAQIAKHSVELAEMVVEQEVFPKCLVLLKEVDVFVKKNSCTLVREIVKHTPELAQQVVSHGGVAALVDYINETSGNTRLPGIMTLGYISAFSETLALSVIVAKAVPPLVQCLINEQEDHIKSATAWTLGQIGRHTPDHAKAVVDNNVLARLLEIYMHEGASEDLKTKCKRALKAIVQKCVHLPALDGLLHSAPPEILKYVVGQFAKVLPNDVQARKGFVTSGGLQRLQELEPEPGSKLGEFIEIINHVYPEDIVRYYTPGYSQSLLEKIESYNV